jgi:hypothetical protein
VSIPDDGIGTYRTGYVLESLLALIGELDCDFAADLIVGRRRDTDAAGFGYAFKAGSNVDTVPEDIIIIDDDVPNVNADAKFDPSVLRHRQILLRYAALDFNGTAYCIDGAGKLDQHTVAGRLDDSTSMGGYRWINKGPSDFLQPNQRAFFVGPHQAAIPSDIRR